MTPSQRSKQWVERNAVPLLAYVVSFVGVISYLRFTSDSHAGDIADLKQFNRETAVVISQIQLSVERTAVLLVELEKRVDREGRRP